MPWLKPIIVEPGMKPVEWFRPPRVILTLFIGLMLVCALALGWLAWQVLVQDRAVEAQRRQEQLEGAADRAVTVIEHALRVWDAQVSVTATGDVEVTPAGRLAYAPMQSASPLAAPEIFADAEVLEFVTHDGARAANVYARLTKSGSEQVRAGAWLRLARVLRHEHRWADALDAYASLERLGTATAVGMPASLVARAARCSTLKESGDALGAQRETAALWTDLTGGRWIITRAILESYLKELKVLAPRVSLPADWEERMAMAEAAEWAFAQPAATGRAGLVMGGRTVSVSWERQGGTWRSQLTAPSTWQALWSKLERDTGTSLRVVDAEGRIIHSGPAGSPGVFRSAAITGLPWSLTASSLANAVPSGDGTARRRLLIGGVLIFALIMIFGSFLIARAISREFAVARLQSDFVSAVSHEFRTPLTSIHQLMEMLAAGRVTDERDKQHAYELILGQSDRLRRMVESLLDFGRMQAREYQFRSDNVDPAEWSRSVAQEFQEVVRSRGYTIEFTGEFAGLARNACIRGDREALAGALWNLLDNAVKYSPDDKRVQVAVSSRHGSVEVSVRDHGCGIAREEFNRIFGRFYRGANARKQGTKGTGIGLAMVKEIVEAHGGTVRVRSDAGQGSEFTMVLPCHES
jgi:signal transduction histidine kinase